MLTLGQMAAELYGIRMNFEALPEEVIERACQMVEKEAKDSLGSYHIGWPQLAASTQADRVRQGYPANEPGLRSGEMRDSIEHTPPTMEDGEVVGYVGSNDPKLLWFELGTVKQPPRTVLMGAAMRKENAIIEMAIKRAIAAWEGRGAGSRAVRELLRATKWAARQWKGAAQSFSGDDE